MQLINGVSMAALLFLLASGFTLAFGLMRVVNLAHGAFYIVGGYLGFAVGRTTGNWALALAAGGIGGAFVGYVSERFLIRRVIKDELAQVLLTIGLAYVIGDVILAIWGGGHLRLSPPEWASGSLTLVGGLIYPRYRLLIIVISGFIALGLWLIQERTALGMTIRASVDDRDMVSALGVRVPLVFTAVFAAASFLAGFAGVLGAGFLTLYPGADWEVLILALVVIIVGGLGSLHGAMVGSLFVGIIDAYGRWLVPELSYIMIFAPMVLLIAVRPEGLYGLKEDSA